MGRDPPILVARRRGSDLEPAIDLPGIGADDLDGREPRDVERDLALSTGGGTEENDGAAGHGAQRLPKRRSSSSRATRMYVGRPCGSPCGRLVAKSRSKSTRRSS